MRVMKTLTINGKTYRVVSDWKDLENRPVQEVPSDTLKWDGDHTGLEKYAGDVSTYKVSDSVPTEADLANGFTIEVQSYGSIQTTTHNDGSFTATGEGALHYGSVVCIINETAAATLGVSAGVYFMRDDSQLYVRSFAINSYSGFTKEVMDPEYLPDVVAAAGSAETPVFDLAAMGLPSIPLTGGSSYLETDASEICAALDKGAVTFVIPFDVDGTTVPAAITMVSASADGMYQCIGNVNFTEPAIVMLNMEAARLTVAAVSVKNYVGIPVVTTDDNGKIMQVVDGAWAAVSVADSAVAAFVEEYINSALEGDY